MKSEIIISAIISVICFQVIFVLACDQKTCEEKGGCCVPDFGVCVVNSTQTAKTYEEATKICSDLGGTLPKYNVTNYNIAKKHCGEGFPFEFKFAFYVLPEPGDICTCVHADGPGDFSVEDHCEHDPAIEVICVIRHCKCE